ncbi:hypothetical protein [Methylobacterium oxalidis]|uniref:hypothetical protein n=1 Tax=Methylobacterium oxalidis TaxID=944322 RepID=UPI003314C9BD
MTRRLCAVCGSAFARLPGQSDAAFGRRTVCLPCAEADLPAPSTASSLRPAAPSPPSPPVSGSSAT